MNKFWYKWKVLRFAFFLNQADSQGYNTLFGKILASLSMTPSEGAHDRRADSRDYTEPAEWAAPFGAVALGTVIYRKRNSRK